jgi:hypothetical protein
MIKKLFVLLAGFTLAAGLAETTLHFFPVSTGYRFQPVNDLTPVIQGEPGFLSTYSKGWNFRLVQQHKLNNFGYPSKENFQTGVHPVLVIGDSYIQAAAIKEDDHIAAQLAESLGVPVYPLGQSGGALSDYLGILEWGVKKFSPQAVVIVIQKGDIIGSLSGEVYHFDCAQMECSNHRTDLTGQSRIKQFLNSSKLFRYLFDNLTFIDNLNPIIHNKEDIQFNSRMIDFFLAEVERIIGKENVVFTVDATSSNKPADELNLFEARAALKGFNVVNLAGSFSKWRDMGVRLNFKPVDGHWNEKAHKIAADEVLPSVKRILAPTAGQSPLGG